MDNQQKSITQQSMQQINAEAPHHTKPMLMRNVNILGFNVPYWVMLALLLILVYYLYHKGYFSSQRQVLSMTDRTILRQYTGVTDGINTPDVVKRTLN